MGKAILARLEAQATVCGTGPALAALEGYWRAASNTSLGKRRGYVNKLPGQ